MNGLMGGGGAAPSGTNGFDVTETWVERAVVVAVSGDLDMLSAPLLDDAIYAAASKEPAAMIVDLTKVEFLATAGMNLLLAAHREIVRSARFGVVADSSPATSRPLKLTGIDNEVALYQTIDDALDEFAGA